MKISTLLAIAILSVSIASAQESAGLNNTFVTPEIQRVGPVSVISKSGYWTNSALAPALPFVSITPSKITAQTSRVPGIVSFEDVKRGISGLPGLDPLALSPNSKWYSFVDNDIPSVIGCAVEAVAIENNLQVVYSSTDRPFYLALTTNITSDVILKIKSSYHVPGK